MSGKRDYYEVLELKKGCSAEEIRNAYKRLAKKWHPDKNRDNREEAERRFKEIAEAYQVLSNQSKRAEYDNIGKGDGFPKGGVFRFNTSFQDPNDLFKSFFGDFEDDPFFKDFGFGDFGLGNMNMGFGSKKGRAFGDLNDFGNLDSLGNLDGFGFSDQGGFGSSSFGSFGFGSSFGSSFGSAGPSMGGSGGEMRRVVKEPLPNGRVKVTVHLKKGGMTSTTTKIVSKQQAESM